MYMFVFKSQKVESHMENDSFHFCNGLERRHFVYKQNRRYKYFKYYISY